MSSINKSLPNHLIFEEILPRLPVKSLLGFKSVSELWLSTISSLEFARSHLQFSSSNPKFIVLAERNRATEDEFYLLDYDDNNNYKIRYFDELQFENLVKFLYIVGSCNGLVCLHVQEVGDREAFFIGNPATRRHRKIMIPQGVRHGPGSRSRRLFYHESSTDDYKILGLFVSDTGRYVQIHVYSMNAGNWTKIGKLDQNMISLDLYLSYIGVSFAPELDLVVLIQDTFYIFIGKFLVGDDYNYVVGFDLITEKFKELPPMNWLNKYNTNMRLRLLELRGCLSLLCTTTDFAKDDVWMLKHSNDGNSRQKLFSINLTGVIYYRLSETGKCLLHTKKELKVFDPSRENPQMSQGGIAFDNGDDIVHSKGYIESLLSPF